MDKQERTYRENGWILASEAITPQLTNILEKRRPDILAELQDMTTGLFYNPVSDILANCVSWFQLGVVMKMHVFEHYFSIDDDMSEEAATLARSIRDVLHTYNRAFAGGCKVFSSPESHQKGEGLGDMPENCVLVIIHDGGSHAGFFNECYEQPVLKKIMDDHLRELGYVAQRETSWYTYIFKNI